MIKYKEIRVGNLILANGKTITVESVDEYGINLEADYYGGDVISTSLEREYELEDLNGIELTEEWLLKLGFVETYKSEYTIKFEFSTNPSIEYIFRNVGHEKFFRCYGFDFKCSYVHDLQNKIFALTGEELTIKE